MLEGAQKFVGDFGGFSKRGLMRQFCTDSRAVLEIAGVLHLIRLDSAGFSDVTIVVVQVFLTLDETFLAECSGHLLDAIVVFDFSHMCEINVIVDVSFGEILADGFENIVQIA